MIQSSTRIWHRFVLCGKQRQHTSSIPITSRKVTDVDAASPNQQEKATTEDNQTSPLHHNHHDLNKAATAYKVRD